MGYLLLIILVVAMTASWPVARWAMHKDGEPAVVIFWQCLTVALVNSLAAVFLEDAHAAPAGVWLAGLAWGIANVLGTAFCILPALQIGPIGPTVTVNNMTMVAGVLYSMLVLAPSRLNAWSVAGVGGVCAALVLLLWFGRPAENDPQRAASARWLRLVVIGGAFLGLCVVAVTHVGTLYPGQKCSFCAAGFGVSAFLLLWWMLRRPERFRLRRERKGGLALGLYAAAVTPLLLMAIRLTGAEVTLPITTATPILLVSVLGHVFYRERLRPAAWAGCVLGAMSLALLCYMSSG